MLRATAATTRSRLTILLTGSLALVVCSSPAGCPAMPTSGGGGYTGGRSSRPPTFSLEISPASLAAERSNDLGFACSISFTVNVEETTGRGGGNLNKVFVSVIDMTSDPGGSSRVYLRELGTDWVVANAGTNHISAGGSLSFVIEDVH